MFIRMATSLTNINLIRKCYMHMKTPFIVVLVLTLCGCEALVDTVVTQPEENELVGVWNVETIDGQTLEMAMPEAQELADYFNIWTFSPDGRYEWIWGWTPGPNTDGVFFSPPVYFSIDGTYTVQGSRFTLKVTNSTFFGDIPESDAGTWVRDGSILTLTFDAGTVIVLKEKL